MSAFLSPPWPDRCRNCGQSEAAHIGHRRGCECEERCPGFLGAVSDEPRGMESDLRARAKEAAASISAQAELIGHCPNQEYMEDLIVSVMKEK